VPELLRLFLTFSRIGALTFGGGYAMLPILQREVVDRYGWAAEEELMDWYAVGQCTPGIIAVNVATFVGQKRRGVLGGVAATLGLVFPSLVIIIFVAMVLQNFAELTVVKEAFAGIRVCVSVLIFNAVYRLQKKAMVDVWAWIIFAVVLFGSLFTNISPVLFILFAAVSGILIKGWEARRR
jgi:chromate transporter